jgi:hypothetical protein
MPAPLTGIMELMMRGNAESQAQAQVKDLAGKQADATSKLQVVMTADPNDPGNPHITVKNAKADLLNQTQDQDLQNAYDAPHKNVESTIAGMNGGRADPGQFEGAALRSVGYEPEKTDRTAADLQTFGQDYRAQRDLGEPIIKAAIKAAIMKTGAWNRDKIAEDLDRNAALRNAGAFQHAVSPILQEEDRMSGMALRGAELKNAVVGRYQQERRLDDAEQKAVATQKQGLIDKTDYSLLDPSEWRKATDEQNTTGVPFNEFEYGRMRRKATQDVAKALDNFMNKDKDQLAVYDSFDKAKAAFGRNLTPQQETQFRANWQVARDARQVAIDREARAQEKWQRLLDGKPDKPLRLPQWQANNLPVDSLVSAIGDPSVHQPSVMLAVQSRYGKLTERLTELHTRAVKNESEHAQITKRMAELSAEIKTNPLAPNAQTSFNQLDARRRHLETDNLGINQLLPSLIEDRNKLLPIVNVSKQQSAAPQFKQTGIAHLSNGTTIRAGTNDGGKTFYDLKTGKRLQ